jgi:hypothetical protein
MTYELPISVKTNPNVLRKLRRLVSVLLFAFFIVAHAACSQSPDGGQKSNSGEKLTHVTTKDAPYYLSGPQQSSPPDGTLKAGTHITIVENKGSYSIVRTKDGIKAYVANDSFKALSTP